MHRIDTKTAQKDKFGAGKNGFTRGNPQTGTPATDLDDDYFDMLQEELCSVVEASGASLEKGRHDQLLTALRALLLSRNNPFGDIKSDGTVPTALENLGLGKGIAVADQGSNANGKWRKYSDGSIELMGFSAAPGSDGLTSVVYPIALPSIPNASAISVSQFSSSIPTTPTTTIVLAGSLSTTGFQSRTLTSAGPTGSGFSWRVFYAAF
ncbi:hypothetical protein P8H85_003347 [Escherichia coli]|nr:hypothetical protein [Escherichia coli]